VTVGSAGQYRLATLLQEAGVAPDKVDIAHLTPPELEAAMTGRGLAAVSTWHPHAARIAAGLGEDAIVLSGGGDYRLTFNLVSFATTVEEKREALFRLIRAFRRAEDFVATSRAEAVDLLAETSGIERAVVEKILNDYDFTVTLNEHVIATLEKQEKWAVGSKLVESELAPGEWRQRVDPSLLREMAPDSVRLDSSR
jgi:ABC-type nitrate/sulfonate/bicarbonate transport system substrate-binding protein